MGAPSVRWFGETPAELEVLAEAIYNEMEALDPDPPPFIPFGELAAFDHELYRTTAERISGLD